MKTHEGVDTPAVDRARGLGPGRRVRRRDERRARRRPGPERLERQALRPRGLRRLRGRQARLRPRQPDEPRQGRRRARPRRRPAHRPRLPRRTSPTRPSSTSRRRAGSPAPSRCARASAPAARPTAGRCARATWSPATRSTPPAGRANALRLVMSGALPADGLANETLQDALDLCLQCKACKTECPSNVDMAKLKAEFLHQYYKGRTVPLGSLLMGHIHRLNPIGSATAPLANWTLRQPRVPVAPGEGRPGSTGGGPCPRSPATTSAAGSAATRSTPAPGLAGTGRAPGRLLHDVQQPRGRPGGGPGARGGRLPRRAGGPALLRPAGDLEGAAPARPRPGPRERPRSSSGTRERGRRSSAASRAAC